MRKSDFYKSLIVREFYYSQQLSSNDLAKKINKSIPFTANIITELIKDGYLLESGHAPSTGGRRPMLFSVNPGNIYILSVAMDQLVTQMALMNIQHKHVVDKDVFSLSLKDSTEGVSILLEKMERLIRRSGISRDKIIGVGIGMPGFVDFKLGINYSFLETSGKTIGQLISDKLSLPVYIDNDSSVIALAESKFGAARSQRNALIINIGWGIGLGLVLNGELYRGQNGFAGELSHIPLFHNDKLCSCGKTGCLETETSLLIMIEKTISGLKTGRKSVLSHGFPTLDCDKDYEAIIRAALKGDQFAVDLLAEMGYNIGRGVAILIHLLNPESIILSGRGAMAGRMLQAPIQQALNKDCIPRLSENTIIALSSLGSEAGLIGAAALVVESRVKERKWLTKVKPGKKVSLDVS